MKLTINTDGGARGNPGPAGIGVVIKDQSGKILKEYGKYIGERTNNEAEYEAVISALESAKEFEPRMIEFRLDSELVNRQINGIYKVKEKRMQELYMKVRDLLIHFKNINFFHVPREQNREADRLVNEAIDKHE